MKFLTNLIDLHFFSHNSMSNGQRKAIVKQHCEFDKAFNTLLQDSVLLIKLRKCGWWCTSDWKKIGPQNSFSVIKLSTQERMLGEVMPGCVLNSADFINDLGWWNREDNIKLNSFICEELWQNENGLDKPEWGSETRRWSWNTDTKISA